MNYIFKVTERKQSSKFSKARNNENDIRHVQLRFHSLPNVERIPSLKHFIIFNLIVLALATILTY